MIPPASIQFINEDNPEWQKITALRIFTSEAAETRFDLRFSTEPTKLTIVGESRETVFILFSDLKEYLTNEVCVCRQPSRQLTRTVSLILLVLPFVFLLWQLTRAQQGSHSFYVAAESDGAMKTANLSAKLDFLIRAQLHNAEQQINGLYIFLPLVLVPVSIFTEDLVIVGLRFFFPADVFLIGAQKEKYDFKKQLRRNMFWGILIAFFVGIAAGVVVWRLTK